MTPFYDEDGITIVCGDCRDVLPLLGPVDHAITDPPYARDVYLRMATASLPLGHTKKTNGFKCGDGGAIRRMASGEIGSVDELISPLAVGIAGLVKRWALVFSDAETTHRWKAELESAGMRYVRTGAWVKPDAMPQMSGDRPSVGFEPCTICHAQGPMRWNGGGRQALWTYGVSKGAARPDHPCPKPIDLMLDLVSQFTDTGDLILDPFMGSGTTLVAAKRLGRRAIGIEIDEKYCEIAALRMAQAVLPLEYEAIFMQDDLLSQATPGCDCDQAGNADYEYHASDCTWRVSRP